MASSIGAHYRSAPPSPLGTVFLLVSCLCFSVNVLAFSAEEHVTSSLLAFPPEEHAFTQRVDHFHATNTATFEQRYLVYDGFWRKNGPILLYMGGEGQIEGFYQATSVLFSSIGPALHALIVFVEHRDYGKSPTLPASRNHKRDLRFLSVEQALADFAVFIQTFKRGNVNRSNAPVLLFGGSYGGMLVAWFRIKYPHLSAGGVVSSGPVDFNFPTLVEQNNVSAETPQKRFWNAVLHTFRRMGGEKCARTIEQGLGDLLSESSLSTALSTSRSLDREELRRASSASAKQLRHVLDDPHALQKIFGTCSAPSDVAAMKRALVQYIKGAVSTLAMVNYPYPHTLVTPQPALPVKIACDRFLSGGVSPSAVEEGAGENRLAALNATVNFYVGEQISCKDIERELVVFKDPRREYLERKKSRSVGERLSEGRDDFHGSVDGGLDMEHWNYQACTALPMQGLTTDFLGFYPIPEDGLSELNAACQARYGVRPSAADDGADFIPLNYGLAVRATTNPGQDELQRSGLTRVVVVDGEFDPWHAGRLMPPPVGCEPVAVPVKQYDVVASSSMGVAGLNVCWDRVRDVWYIPPVRSAAHHQDLVSERREDSAELRAARTMILQRLRGWMGDSDRQVDAVTEVFE